MQNERISEMGMAKWNKILHASRKVVPVLVGILLLVLVIAWLGGMFEEKVEPGVVVRPVRHKPESLPEDLVHEVEKEVYHEVVGTLKAANRVVIAAKVLATIEEITVRAGDTVTAGDLLVRLDDADLQARKRQAEQEVVAAEATYNEAKREFDRVKSLFEQNVVTRADYDRAQRALTVADADRRRAQEALKEAMVMLSYTQIRAPKSGRVVDRLAEPGDLAQPGKPLLILYDAESLRVEAPVPESLAMQLKVGEKLKVRIDALGEEFESAIVEIVPQADAPSRSFLVKVALPKRDDLYEGMVARLFIPAGVRRHLCLAADAVIRVGQLEFVDVIRKDGTLERRLIKTGRFGMPGRLEVLSGLEANERVVLYPKQSHGKKVTKESKSS